MGGIFLFFIKFFKFLYYFVCDVRDREIKYPYGVWLFVGLPGRGKTISAVEYCHRMKLKYPDVKIYTNFNLSIQDDAITHWRDLLNYESPAIFVLDEVQLTFNSRAWADFPPEMVTLLTQNRKDKKQIIATAQSFARVDKVFRELTNFVIECRCLAGRWVFQRAFETEDYMNGLDPQFGKRRRRAWRYNFVQDNAIRDSFDTLLKLDSLKKEEFVNFEERRIKSLLQDS